MVEEDVSNLASLDQLSTKTRHRLNGVAAAVATAIVGELCDDQPRIRRTDRRIAVKAQRQVRVLERRLTRSDNLQQFRNLALTLLLCQLIASRHPVLGGQR